MWAAIAAVALCLAGCGDNGDKDRDDKDRNEDRARAVVGRTQALQARLDQLEDTLDQLELETEIQRNRISAAKGDLSVIRETIASAEDKAIRYIDRTTTGAVLVRDTRVERRERQEVRDERERAENRTLSTVLLLSFLAIVIIFGGKLWRDRNRAANGITVTESPSASTSGSYTYPAGSAPGEPIIETPAPEASGPGDSATDFDAQPPPDTDENPPTAPTV
jgi:hypothetical protein